MVFSIKNVYVDEGIPLLRILNIEPNKIDLTEIAHLEESKRQEIGSGFVYEGDLLVSVKWFRWNCCSRSKRGRWICLWFIYD